MSQENVDLAHRAYEAFNRRDWGAFLALMDRDVEVESRSDTPSVVSEARHHALRPSVSRYGRGDGGVGVARRG
jgi:ketosteroid isomerase-like protein